MSRNSAKRFASSELTQQAVLRWLRAQGALVAVTDAGAAYRAGAFFGDAIPAGWPDITGLLPDGRFIGVECKAPACPEQGRRGGRQSRAQKAMEREIRRRGGIYVLAYGIEDVKKAIDRARSLSRTAGTSWKG